MAESGSESSKKIGHDNNIGAGLNVDGCNLDSKQSEKKMEGKKLEEEKVVNQEVAFADYPRDHYVSHSQSQVSRNIQPLDTFISPVHQEYIKHSATDLKAALNGPSLSSDESLLGGIHDEEPLVQSPCPVAEGLPPCAPGGATGSATSESREFTHGKVDPMEGFDEDSCSAQIFTAIPTLEQPATDAQKLTNTNDTSDNVQTRAEVSVSTPTFEQPATDAQKLTNNNPTCQASVSTPAFQQSTTDAEKLTNANNRTSAKSQSQASVSTKPDVEAQSVTSTNATHGSVSPRTLDPLPSTDATTSSSTNDLSSTAPEPQPPTAVPPAGVMGAGWPGLYPTLGFPFYQPPSPSSVPGHAPAVLSGYPMHPGMHPGMFSVVPGYPMHPGVFGSYGSAPPGYPMHPGMFGSQGSVISHPMMHSPPLMHSPQIMHNISCPPADGPVASHPGPTFDQCNPQSTLDSRNIPVNALGGSSPPSSENNNNSSDSNRSYSLNPSDSTQLVRLRKPVLDMLRKKLDQPFQNNWEALANQRGLNYEDICFHRSECRHTKDSFFLKLLETERFLAYTVGEFLRDVESIKRKDILEEFGLIIQNNAF